MTKGKTGESCTHTTLSSEKLRKKKNMSYNSGQYYGSHLLILH